MGFITQEGLVNLKNYKYVSGGYSVLDKVFNHWWEFFVKLIPMNVAPNLITLTGLVINIIGTFAYMYYDLTFTVPVPQWVYFFGVFCQFMYQTLDAVDGKQARRTGSSSPLGQLFDHGCDAVCVFFGLASFLQAVTAGPTWMGLAVGFSLTCTFYTQQWEEYHAHVLRTFIGWFGVTEGILMTLSIILATGFTDGALPHMELGSFLTFLPEAIAKITVLQVIAVIALYNAISYAYQNLTYALQKTSETKSEALCGLLPLLFFYAECAIVFTTEWGLTYPALGVLLVMPSYCLMTCRHIICSVTKMKFDWRQLNPLWFILFPINKVILSVLPFLKSAQVSGAVNSNLFPESWIAGIVFLATFILFIKFTVETIGQITSYLGINCLTIKKKEI